MIVLIIIAVTLTLASARTNCTHDDQCGTGECCYNHVGPLLMSKRDALSQGIDIMDMHQGGWCETYKLQGDSCGVMAKMNGHCECGHGLTCHFVPEPTQPVVSKRKIYWPGPGDYRCVPSDSLTTRLP